MPAGEEQRDRQPRDQRPGEMDKTETEFHADRSRVSPSQDAFRPEHLDQEEASGPNYEWQDVYES